MFISPVSHSADPVTSPPVLLLQTVPLSSSLREEFNHQHGVLSEIWHKLFPRPDVGACMCDGMCLCVSRQTRLPALPSFASANGTMMPVSDHCNYTFKFLHRCQMLSLSFPLPVSVSPLCLVQGFLFPWFNSSPVRALNQKTPAEVKLETWNFCC